MFFRNANEITISFFLVSVNSMKAQCEKFLKEFDKLEFNDDIDDGKFEK